MIAKNIMTQKIVKASMNASIKEAIKLCVDHQVGLLIVVDDQDEMIGILSEKDIIVAYDFLAGTEAAIQEFVTKEVVSVREDTPIEEIGRLLVQRNFKNTPVVRDKKVIGVVSRGDILKWLAENPK